MDTKFVLDNWVHDYIQFQENYDSNFIETYSDEDWKPVWDFQERLFSDSELFWQSILKVLEETNSEKVLSLLACGPLEDLIELHGDIYIARIEELATKNDKFKQLLELIWQSGDSEVWHRIMQLRTTPDFFKENGADVD